MESRVKTYKPKASNEKKLKVFLKKIEHGKSDRLGSSSRK